MGKKIATFTILLFLFTSIAYALDNNSRLSDWIKASEDERVSFCKEINLGGFTEWHTWYKFLETSKIFYPEENGKLLDYCKMMNSAAGN